MAPDRAAVSWVVLPSFFIALVLAIISLPDFVPDYLAYARPHWLALVLIYWIIYLPEKIGLIVAWTSGLLIDVLEGGLLGQHALAYLVIGFIVANLYQRMRMYTVWQQASLIFGALLVGDLIIYLIDLLTLGWHWNYLYLLPSFVSALLWPWLFLSLRQLRGQFNFY